MGAPVKEGWTGNALQCRVESSARCERGLPAPLGTGLAGQKLRGSPAVDYTPSIRRAKRARNTETQLHDEALEKTRCPLDLFRLGLVYRLEYEAAYADAPALPSIQRDGEVADPKGVENSSGRELNLVCGISHIGHPADAPALDASTFLPAALASAEARTTHQGEVQRRNLLCNGAIVFDDTGELLPDGRVVAPHRVPTGQLAVAA
jgi:hypothetical protein